MSWRPAQVYVATFVTFMLGVFFSSITTLAITSEVHKKDVSRVEKQSLDERNKFLGRITDLEAELANERQVNDDIELRRIELERQLAETRKARASRSRRATALPALVWTHSRHGIQIANCESADLNDWPWSDGSRYLGGEKGVHLHDQPTYTGKWQIGPDEWRDWDGLRFAPAPYLATELEQDIVAEEGHRQRGEQSWVCSRKV